MGLQIDKDHQRFRKIVKGKIRKDLRKFLTRSELLGREGKKYISIPVQGIDTPHFRYGDNSDGGVGKGDGKPGDKVGEGGDAGPGGTEEGHHILEVDVSHEELAEILGPYYLHCIEAFGPDRCMFESNFPVDKVSCSYTVLWNCFKRLTQGFAESERAALFHDTAVRVYRL